MSIIKQPLSNVQLELLKIFSHNLSDQDLLRLKKKLVQFFYEIATEEADKAWDNQGWDEDKVQELLNKKLRSNKKE